MKSILTLLVLVFSFQSYALPVANSLGELDKDKIVNVTSVPSFEDNSAKLAVTVQYANRCVAEQSSIVYRTLNTSLENLHLYSIWNTGLACTTEYSPVSRVTLINMNYEIGDDVIINGHTRVTVKAPQSSICTQDLCSDGEPRDQHTCACSNGFFR